MFRLWLCLLLVTVGSMAQAAEHTLRPQKREVAVTFDDLPFVLGHRNDAQIRALSTELIRKLKENGIPAIGFVNEVNLFQHGQKNPERIGILNDWLVAGLELGNHTATHVSLNRVPLADFEQDFMRGETVTRELMAAHNMKPRYFRHPYLHVGKDALTRSAFEKFLAEHDYTVAPVTINCHEWVFAAAYDKAAAKHDEAAMQRVAEAYISYMEQVLVAAEGQSLELFGYEIKQILVLHANALNAEHLGELAPMLKRRGYSFITVDEALKDRAYQSPNVYAGENGVSWLDQWDHAVGLRPPPEIKVPVFVRGLAGRTTYFGY